MSIPMSPRRIGSFHILAAAMCVVMNPQRAVAGSFTSSTLTFVSPTQSIWGPGSTAAAFASSGFLLGNSTTGVSYSSSASTGTVSSRVTGRMGATFDDVVPLSSSDEVHIGIDFLGGSSSFQSDLGANMRVNGHLFDIVNNFPIFNRDYLLDIHTNFTSETPRTATGSDEFSPAAVSVGLPTGGVGLSGTAGVELDIQQDATLRTLRFDGVLVATHAGTGATSTVPFDVDALAGETLAFNLGIAGLWDFRFLDLRMTGDFTSLFSAEFEPFIGGGIGVFCGDPFDPDDNFLCAREGGVKTDEFISVDLFRSPRIDLNYNQIGEGGEFSLMVADDTTVPEPVPEPGTLSLILAGSGALGWIRRRRRRSQ